MLAMWFWPIVASQVLCPQFKQSLRK